ncbi:MAG: hypothetical protein WC943_07615 [Elusimicrobiota bacterium]|jgi:hypothetical protein
MKRASIFVPIFAILVAAGQVSAVEQKAPEQKAPEQKAPAQSKEELAITALAKQVVGSAAVRDDVAKRLAKFMLEDDAYILEAARKDGLEAKLAAMPKAWVELKFKGDNAAKLAVVRLYYVLGDSGEQKWAKGNANLIGALGGFKRDQLVTNMKPWSASAQAAAGANPGVNAGPLSKLDGKTADWVSRFLDTAADYSQKILESASISKELKLESIFGHEERSPVQGGIGAQVNRLGSSAGYGDDDLFRNGAATSMIYAEGDKSAREVSVRMISYKAESGGVENQVAVWDITYPEDKFCQRFPINRSGGETTFALDDRKPGQRKYTLKFATDETGIHVSFGRPATVGGGAGKMITTSVQGLAVLRAQHVLDMNRVVVINGVEYLVAGQTAGKSGEHLYYRKDSLQSTAEADLKPEFVAQVVTKQGDSSVIATHRVILGKVNGKDYHTIWDPAERKFKIAEGPGEAPPAASVGAGTTNPGAGAGTGTTNPASNCPPGLDAVECQFYGAGHYAPNFDVNKAIKPLGLLRVHSITAAGEDWVRKEHSSDYWIRRHIIFIPNVTKGKALYVRFEPNEKGYYTDGTPPLRVIKESRYLLTVSDGGQVYLDLKGTPSEKDGFPVAGRLKFKEGGKSIEMADGADMEIVKLLIGEVLKEADAEKALKNLAEVTKGRKLASIRGTASSLVAVFDSLPNTQFWPKVGDAPETGGSFPDATGKGETIFQGAAGGPPAPFKDSVEVGTADNLDKLKIYNGLKKKNAALYVNEVEKGKGTSDKPRKWFIQFNFRNPAGNPDKPDQDFRSAYIEMPVTEGGRSVPFPYEAKTPSVKDGKPVVVDVDINEDGVTVLTEEQAKINLLTQTPVVGRPVSNPSPSSEKGVYAVFLTGARDAQNKPKNCLAPILWWGMDKKAAVQACQDDGY